jgi:hypothetical protein
MPHSITRVRQSTSCAISVDRPVRTHAGTGRRPLVGGVCRAAGRGEVCFFIVALSGNPGNRRRLGNYPRPNRFRVHDRIIDRRRRRRRSEFLALRWTRQGQGRSSGHVRALGAVPTPPVALPPTPGSMPTAPLPDSTAPPALGTIRRHCLPAPAPLRMNPPRITPPVGIGRASEIEVRTQRLDGTLGDGNVPHGVNSHDKNLDIVTDRYGRLPGLMHVIDECVIDQIVGESDRVELGCPSSIVRGSDGNGPIRAVSSVPSTPSTRYVSRTVATVVAVVPFATTA